MHGAACGNPCWTSDIRNQPMVAYHLNLEYLLAEAYSCWATGTGIPASLRGGGPPSIGCQKLNFQDPFVAVRRPLPRGRVDVHVDPSAAAMLCAEQYRPNTSTPGRRTRSIGAAVARPCCASAKAYSSGFASCFRTCAHHSRRRPCPLRLPQSLAESFAQDNINHVTALRASIAGSANPIPLLNVGMAAAPNASVTAFINLALQAAGLGSKAAPASKPVAVPVTPGGTCAMTCANYCKVSPSLGSPRKMRLADRPASVLDRMQRRCSSRSVQPCPPPCSCPVLHTVVTSVCVAPRGPGHHTPLICASISREDGRVLSQPDPSR